MIAPRSAKTIERQRRLGAYYTPEKLSRILADWAIRSPSDTVLEPSFGGCGFLEAARTTLARLGCSRPEARIFGCDLDPLAFDHLEQTFSDQDSFPGFIYGDFLGCTGVPTWPASFSTILANPPYIPYQRIPAHRRAELRTRRTGISGVEGRSGLWAYFVSHAVSMLREGGRMAWVLPGAMLQADYAQPIRTYLGRRFERSAAIIIRERLFLEAGTDEETVILLAEGHSASEREGSIEVGEAQTIENLENIVDAWTRREWSGNRSTTSPAEVSMDSASVSAFGRLSRLDRCAPLGTTAKVRIGIVTGANDFFVLSASRLASVGLRPEDCSPIVSKFRGFTGLTLDPERQEQVVQDGGRSFLVDARAQPDNPRILDYLGTFDPSRREAVSTFRKRRVWSEACDGQIPDAFFPVMHHHGPRLVLNGLGCNCTNTVHRVFFKAHVHDHARKLFAVSLLTTFSQMSAELVGRRYGSGVLKHEPRDAERILILSPDVDGRGISTTFDVVDDLLRAGDHVAARHAADDFILSGLGPDGEGIDVDELRRGLAEMRRRRTPNRRPPDAITAMSRPT